ncbi:unnamed protein product [Prorocentrum cordatum]|uniref:Uncharacterized protein n=1 Tax=Prorocentrum cordatum TaxID=2364126 RepID=A0ABN9WP78_9DINO|nr:unnamed protein product [Polarella glacialis]
MDLQRAPRVLLEVTSAGEITYSLLTADSRRRTTPRSAAQANVSLRSTSLRRTEAELEEASSRERAQECRGDRTGSARSEPAGRPTFPSPGRVAQPLQKVEGKVGKEGTRLPAASADRTVRRDSLCETLPKIVAGGERHSAGAVSPNVKRRVYSVAL